MAVFLSQLCHALPIQPHFADAFDAREHVIDSLVADAYQLCPDDAGDEIAREIENCLWCRAVESFAKNRRYESGTRMHFQSECHASVCSPLFIHVQIDADCI